MKAVDDRQVMRAEIGMWHDDTVVVYVRHQDGSLGWAGPYDSPEEAKRRLVAIRETSVVGERHDWKQEGL